MPGMGPPPKPQERRAGHTATVAMTRIPLAGRQGGIPVWPLAGLPSEYERELWREIWFIPQAVMWEKLGWHRDVAMYCRYSILAETSIKSSAEARQYSDRLGLTPLALLRLRWEIVDMDAAPAAQASASAAQTRYGGLTVVPPSQVAGG